MGGSCAAPSRSVAGLRRGGGADRLDLDHAGGIEPAAHRGGDGRRGDGAVAEQLGGEPVGLLGVEHVALDDLRPVAALEKMELLRRGSRLSVQPVTAGEWKAIEKLAEKKAKAK